jgi:uncharacterized membrane protein YcaP (DUF421 family)
MLLVKDGVYIEGGFRKARVTRYELQAHMRTNSKRDVCGVEESHLEVTGQISFIKKKEEQQKSGMQ